MIILSDKNICRTRVLMPVSKKQWITPSRAQQKTFCGDEDKTIFRIKARLNDGHPVWSSWFEDRDDADAFLYSLASGFLRYEKELWKLPNIEWHPGIGTELSYELITQTFLTTTGSNQTYTSPVDWNNSSNIIRCLGGAGGGARYTGSGNATGGGGGAYSEITNFSFATPGTTTATYRVGSGGAGLASGTSDTNGNPGSATWFNNTTDPGNGSDNSQCSAAGGNGGLQASTASTAGGTQGLSTNSWGQTKYSGGRGGNWAGAGSLLGATGAGAAAGPAGVGGNGQDVTGAPDSGDTSDGGRANGGIGARGGGNNGGAGVNGTEFSVSYGCGGGGGAGYSSVQSGGNGGNYGGGGGGIAASSSVSLVSGSGRQGLVVIEYTAGITSLGNLPMLGM